MGKSTISMAMFNSYVKLQEGKLLVTTNYHASLQDGFIPHLSYLSWTVTPRGTGIGHPVLG